MAGTIDMEIDQFCENNGFEGFTQQLPVCPCSTTDIPVVLHILWVKMAKTSRDFYHVVPVVRTSQIGDYTIIIGNQ